jgi:hypothetical protein
MGHHFARTIQPSWLGNGGSVATPSAGIGIRHRLLWEAGRREEVITHYGALYDKLSIFIEKGLTVKIAHHPQGEELGRQKQHKQNTQNSHWVRSFHHLNFQARTLADNKGKFKAFLLI